MIDKEKVGMNQLTNFSHTHEDHYRTILLKWLAGPVFWANQILLSCPRKVCH